METKRTASREGRTATRLGAREALIVLGAIVSLAKKEALRLQTGPELIRREDALAMINGLASKVVAVWTVHRALAVKGPEALDLKDVLGEILQPLTELYGDRLRMDLRVDSGCAVGDGRGSVLALALAEIVTNAMKYAHPTGLPVEISVVGTAPPDGRVMLEISDDGVGLPDGFDPERDSGVGMKMVRYMIDSIEGQLTTSSDEFGLTFSIVLPAKRSAGKGDHPPRA